MMWDQVMARVMEELTTDPVLVGIFGTAFRQAGPADAQEVPMLEWRLVGDTEGELWAPVLIQFDLWTLAADTNRRAEFRVRSLYHRDMPYFLADLRMMSSFEDGAVLATPERSGFYGRAIRFRFYPLRRKFALRESA
jgi:hypothetical protein